MATPGRWPISSQIKHRRRPMSRSRPSPPSPQTQHFDGYSAVLIHLAKVTEQALEEAIVDGWLACAPQKLIDQYLKT